MSDSITKKVLGNLGQIATETGEKIVKETVNITGGVITGQELVGDIKPMGEVEMAKVKAEEEKKKQEELEKLKNIPGRNVEKEIKEVRDEKKQKEEEQKKFLENLQKQRDAEKAEREKMQVDETANPEREAKKKQFVPGPKKKQRPDPYQMSQTSEFKGKID